MGVHCCCLHVNYIVYKHFDKSLHIGSLDPTCVQNFRPVPLTVFEIYTRIQTEEREQEEKWTFCHISHARVKCYGYYDEMDFLPYLPCKSQMLWVLVTIVIINIMILKIPIFLSTQRVFMPLPYLPCKSQIQSDNSNHEYHFDS